MASKTHKKKLEHKTYHLAPTAFPGSPAGKGCMTKCLKGKAFGTTKKHGDYWANGYETIKGDKGKADKYNVAVKFKADEKLPTEVRHGLGGKRRPVADVKTKPDAWKIGDAAPADNFKLGYKPYNHDYHHIMPAEALHNGLPIDACHALMEAGYSLNDGINLIILPKLMEVGEKIKLYHHVKGHPTYSESVKNELKAINGEVRDAKKLCDPAKIKLAKDAIERWESATFDDLVSISQSLDIDQHSIKPIKLKKK